MDRKEFITKTSAGVLIGIPFVSMIGCSSSDDGMPLVQDPPDPGNPDPGDPQANCIENGTDTSISANHGHNLTVSKEDVEAGVEKTYTLTQANTDQHVHQVTITSSQFASLKNNSDITVSSSSDAGHSHNVTVACA